MLTAIDIERMPYPDFVAFLGQDNAPPGGEGTIRQWIRRGGIGPHDRVLDLACSTGLSGRTIARSAGCRVVGVDLCDAAIAEARRKAATDGLAAAAFHVGDATALQFADGSFEAVVAGSCFGFIQPAAKALAEAHRVLVTRGRLCIANFFYRDAPPQDVLDRVERRVGFRPRPEWSRDYWNAFFGTRFELEHEENHSLDPLPVEQIARTAAHRVTTATGPIARLSPAEKRLVLARLLVDRLAFNEHRRYQMRNVQVWKRRDSQS